MKKFLAAILAAALVAAIHILPAAGEAPQTKTLRILATGDLHGKFCPWDYALNEASPSGSMAQLSGTPSRTIRRICSSAARRFTRWSRPSTRSATTCG